MCPASAFPDRGDQARALHCADPVHQFQLWFRFTRVSLRFSLQTDESRMCPSARSDAQTRISAPHAFRIAPAAHLMVPACGT